MNKETEHDQFVHLVAEALAEVMKDVRIPEYFLIRAGDLAEVVVMCRKVMKEKVLTTAMNKDLKRIMSDLLDNAKTLSGDDMNQISDALGIASQQHEWKEASNVDWYANV